MSDLAARLRALPGFPDEMPELALEALPEDPLELFRDWIEDAIASGARQPHAMTFQTVQPDGAPVGRTLILKDLDAHGFHIATSAASRKAQQLAADPRAAMTFFWRESGRQVQVSGVVVELGEEVSQRDWLARPTSDGRPNPQWQVLALRPERIDFMQASEDRNHARVGYVREGARWRHSPVQVPSS